MPKLNDCTGCKKPLPKSEFMRCASCKGSYDLICINMSAQRFHSFYMFDKERRNAWKCPECLSKNPKNDNQNTPVRAVTSPENSSNVTQRVKSANLDFSCLDMEKSRTMTETGVECQLNPTLEWKMFWEEMRAMRAEVSIFRTAISDLTATIQSQNERLTTLESRVQVLESNVTDPHSILNLEQNMVQLQLEINERDQDMLANDIEISNFPENTNENCTHVILTVAAKLGVAIDERDVVSAQSIGAPRTVAAAAAGPARPRPLAVRLARRASREALLQAARVRRSLTTQDMQLAETGTAQRLYINERLTRRNRLLFQKAREAAKQLNWRFVWTRDGKIFARQENGKARYRITTEDDLAKVFGASAVGKN